jgi:SulP family sulfate permease
MTLDVRRDGLAALTVTAVAIPQVIAYAQIADLPVQVGLYAAIVPAIVGALAGRSRFLVTGTTNSFAMLTLAAVAPIITAAADLPRYLELVWLLAFMVGLFQLTFGVLRIGALFRYISDAVVMGFSTGLAVLIALNQFQYALGVAPAASVVHPLLRIWDVVGRVSETHTLTLGVTVGTVLLITGLLRVSQKIPAYFIAVAMGVLLTWALDLSAHGLATVPSFTATPLSFSQPLGATTWTDMELLLGAAVALAAVGALESATLASVAAHRTGEVVDANREVLARGAANVSAAFTGGLPVSGSYGRTALNLQADAASRWSAILQGVLIAISIFLVAPIASYIPKAVLAGTLMVVASRMALGAGLGRLWRSTPGDGTTLVVTTCLVIVDIRWGLLVGIFLSLAFSVMRASRLEINRLYPGEGGLFYQAAIGPEDTATYPRVLLLQVMGEMFFGAAQELRRTFDRILAAEDGPRVVILRLKAARHLDATIVSALWRFHNELEKRERKLVLCGLSPTTLHTLQASGLSRAIGEDYILSGRGDMFGSVKTALARGETWIEQNPHPDDPIRSRGSSYVI